MVKIVLSETYFGGFIYQGNPELTVSNNHNKAVYTDDQTGDKIIITGKNLTAQAGNDDLFASGTIETVKLQRSDGEVMVTATKGNFDAEKLSEALDQDGVSGFYDAMLRGKDQIYGSSANNPIYGMGGDDLILGGKGDDTIHGGKGDDELLGGSGSDTFVFSDEDKGHDVIKDFDIKGPVVDYLQFSPAIQSIKPIHGGADTMIHLDNGASVLLEGVEKADFIDYWQMMT